MRGKKRIKRRRQEANNLYNQYLQTGLYEHTSSAHQLDPLPAPREEREIRQPKPVVKRKKVVKDPKRQRGTRVRYELNFLPVKKMSVLSLIITLVLMVGVGTSLFLFSHVSAKQQELSLIKNDIQKTKEEILYKNSEAVANIDLDEVEEIASSKLSMAPPKDYQEIEIDVPNESYFTQYEEKIEEPTIIDGIQSIFSSKSE